MAERVPEVQAAIDAVAAQLRAHAEIAQSAGTATPPEERRSFERRLRDAAEGMLDALDAYSAAVRAAHGVTVPWVLPAMLSIERSFSMSNDPEMPHAGAEVALDITGRWRYHVPDLAAFQRYAGTAGEVELDDALAVLLHRIGFADVDPLGHVPEEFVELDVADVRGRVSADVSRPPEGGYPTAALPPLGERPLTSVRLGVQAPTQRAHEVAPEHGRGVRPDKSSQPVRLDEPLDEDHDA